MLWEHSDVDVISFDFSKARQQNLKKSAILNSELVYVQHTHSHPSH